jgi:amino acid adenylation domain-containing protein
VESNVISTDGAPGSGGGGADMGPKLIAATAALLQRYTDRAEVLIGYTPGAGQAPRALAIDLAGEPSFSKLLARVNEALAGARNGRDGQLDLVLAFDQDPPADPGSAPWLTARRRPDGLDLALHGDGNGSGLGNDELLVGHIRTLLAGATAQPDEAIEALPVLTESERQQLLVEWNDTASDYPRACLHELTAAQAQKTPDAVAVQFRDEQLTYAQLDERANQLAHHLIALGVGPETLVGICVERSLEMLIGLIGIMKAGGAYVPIDPAYPAERQEYMLTNSEAPVIVTQERLRSSLPASQASVVCLDTDWATIATLPAVAPDVEASPEQLAYVIYTSGSTGLPKGVQIPHRALVNFLVTMGQTPGLAPDDVLVAVTTLSFDIAGLELYVPLTLGARVVIAPADSTGDPRALSTLLDHSGATIMQATPTTWRMLVDAGWTPPRNLKALCGGEALPVALADRLVGLGLELWNMYGPTETTIWSSCARVETQSEPLTIGRPIANTTLYILDARMQPVPVGVPGELWIGGDGLARGYRGRPDLTEERFVAHPFDASPGARIYRTGDLARYRPDGSVGFLGRIDHQVKVRGFRIELGEIETVLARHPAIAEAVVVARGTDAEAELAAYVLAPEGPVTALELREFLTQTLPAYMIPSTVTTLEAFPLTPNGKVDRKALPEPTRERSGDRELVAPRTPLEKRLAGVWERELGIPQIGVTDNFFDLGVTSIVAASLFAAIEHDLGDGLPLGAIFRAPTIEALAKLIEDGEGESRWTSLVPIQPQGSRPPIFCVHGGAGTILHLQPLSRRLGPDQPFYGLQSSGLYGGSAPLETVEEMAAHYLSEMRQVHPPGPWYIAGYCFGTNVAFEMAQRLVAEGEDVRMLTMFNGPSPPWLRKYAWYGNQPSFRKKRPKKPPMTTKQRLLRALRDPRRFGTALVWYARREFGARQTKYALRRGKPLPERLREQYFLTLHMKTERAYEPTVYPGEVLLFHGEGLYEDPNLGWTELARDGIKNYPVPGEHTSNREAMREPHVAFIAERIQEYLEQTAPSQP